MNRIDEKLHNVFEKCFGNLPQHREQYTKENIDSWDSLTHIKLIIAIENEFEMRIEPPFIPLLHTNFLDIANFLRARDEKN